MSDRASTRGGSSVLARLAEPTASAGTRVAVIGDPHLATRATGTTRQFDRTEAFLRAAFDDIVRRDVDLVLSVGDLTKDGAPWDFDRFDELLGTLDAPFRSVPGNHDVPKDDDDHAVLSRSAFVDRYTPGTLPFHERVGDIDLVGLDTATTPDGRLSGSADGYLSPEQRDWLEGTLASAPNPLVVMHHNLPAFTDQLGEYREGIGAAPASPTPVRNAGAVHRRLAAGDASLVLTGHRHRPGVGHDRGVTEVAAPALCVFPQAYLLLVIDERGTTVRYVPFLPTAAARRAYGLQLEDGAVPDKVALASIHLSQLPLREEWTP